MIVFYLFIIAVIGAFGALLWEHKQTKKSLLQIFKSSCTIDSVQFEKHLVHTQTKLYSFKKNLFQKIRFIIHTCQNVIEHILSKVKYSIRKKLHVDSKNETPSDFIQKIRK